MIKVVQIGLGPLGIQIAKYIKDKSEVITCAVVDIDPDLCGKSLDQIEGSLARDVFVFGSIKEALQSLPSKPDVALITTVSALEKLIQQVEEVALYGIPVVSTCEELAYPWTLQPELSKKLDNICKENGIACLGTGINPGFLMDYLPSVLSSVCKNIEQITVERIQDATPRRIPFQKKIGAGLDLAVFEAKKEEGTLRHVGLPESVYLLSACIGMRMDRVEEEIRPVISNETLSTTAIQIKAGNARGVEQLAYGYVNGHCAIKMRFKAAIGEPRSFDRITIKGTPSFTSEIDGGVNGDIATCAIAINAIKSVLKASPGLHTMADIAVPGYMN